MKEQLWNNLSLLYNNVQLNCLQDKCYVLNDSPQPQVSFAFGLMKTNSDFNRSSTKSILVPITDIRACGSINTFTPKQSI